MWPIFQTLMFIYQSKANLDEQILFGKVTHLYDPNNLYVPLRVGFVGIKNSTFCSGL